MSGSGGAAAAFGFRYQYLVTVETLLDLHEGASMQGWRVGVDVHGQDSADILIFLGAGGSPSRAVQVKASMRSTARKMDLSTAQRCLEALAEEHPTAERLSLRTNRVLNGPASDYAQQLSTSQSGPFARWSIDARSEDVSDIVSQLIGRIARIRQRGSGGIGRRVHYVLLTQLIDLVAERGSQTALQLIDHGDVASILDEPPALLADAVRTRSWGRAYGMPRSAFLPRPAVAGFLTEQLTESALYRGTPPIAVLRGLSGSGKSAAAAAWAANYRENYAVSLWLDATTDQGLSEQVPMLLDWLGVDREIGDSPAQDLCDALSELSVPWLLVLDGARDHAVTSRWTPVSGYGHVIITTNRGDWPTDTAPLHEIAAMTDDEAVALIRHRLPPSTAGDDEVALRFAARLGRWPLAIDLACAWVRRLGGDYAGLAKFVSRLDRLDLMADATPLGSYPKKLAGVVGELWDNLSAQSQVLLGIVVVSGGVHVPRLMLDRWADSLPSAAGLEIDAGSAIEELVTSALVTCRLRDDADDVRALDEVVYVHEGIQAVLPRCLGTQVGFVACWVTTFADTVEELLDESNLADAAALLPVAAELIASLRSSVVLDDDGQQALGSVLLLATMMMHNFGVVATLTRLFGSASAWLRLALDIREEVATEDQRATTGHAALQIETLGALVQVALRQDRLDRIQPIVEEALRHLDTHSVDELERAGVAVTPALDVLKKSLQYAPKDCSHLRARLDAALASATPRHYELSALQNHLLRFNDVTERARRLATAEQWSRAVDTVLIAANEAVASGVLEHDAVEAVLDCGLELMVSRLRRIGPLPPAWAAALTRLAEWGESYNEAFEPTQHARLSILRPLVENNADQLRLALDEARSYSDDSRMVAAWVAMGETALESMAAARRFGHLLSGDRLPEGMRLIRTLDGGADCRWWPIVAGDRPMLAFTSVSAVSFVGTQVLDPVREAMIAAGFPDHLDAGGQPQHAEGWSVRVESDTLALEDPNRTRWLTIEMDWADPNHRQWIEALNRVDELCVIYRDIADLTPDEIVATGAQAMVAVRRPDQPMTRPTGAPTALRRWLRQWRDHVSRDSSHRRSRKWAR